MAEFSFRTSTMRAPPRHEHEGHVDPSRAVRARRDINPIPEITDEGNDGPPVLGFDWTPAYFGAAGDVYDVPARVAEMMPWAKFVVLLRDPADSATWNWLVPARLQKLKAMKVRQIVFLLLTIFSYFIDNLLETHVLVPPPSQPRTPAQNETELSTADCTYARLRKWLELFPRERFFVVRYEDMYKGEARRAQILAEVAAFLGVPQVQYRRSHLAEYKLQEVTNAKSRQSDAHRAFAHLDKTTMPAFVARCRALVDNMVGDGGNVWGGEDEVAESPSASRGGGAAPKTEAEVGAYIEVFFRRYSELKDGEKTVRAHAMAWGRCDCVRTRSGALACPLAGALACPCAQRRARSSDF